MPTIEIDGQQIEVEKGQTIIQAADRAGIHIPRFCYHNKLSVAANCRMCLVDVEKAPKPAVACATPVGDGMRVFTRSARAIESQKATMEFLLINHPLDCPICDQGGECPLQDQALGYGKGVSRFTEGKRSVDDQDLGPLIQTDMTRCIHCTRCVRFGAELGGRMEMGAWGRTENMRIGTFLGRSIDSEVSGNMIDICPVGALTSKPYRYHARPWELRNNASVSPHDCVGTNLNIQTLRKEIRRVLPRRNEPVNECWLADRDRFAYEGLNSPERLTQPRVRVDGRWEEVDWRTALDTARRGIASVIDGHGPGALGALASPLSTLEEMFLLGRLMRGLGSGNIDHRLYQRDFRGDGEAPLYPALGRSIESLERAGAVLLVGSNVRKDQPLIAMRLRKAQRSGARIMAVNPVAWDAAIPLHAGHVCPPSQMPRTLARLAKMLCEASDRQLPAQAAAWLDEEDAGPGAEVTAMSSALREAADSAGGVAVLLGDTGVGHADYAALQGLCTIVADACGGTSGQMVPGHGAGGWLAGCLPHRGACGEPVRPVGMDAVSMIDAGLRGFVLLGTEPELDCADGARVREVLAAADFVVALTAYADSGEDYAHVQLPVAAYAENEGTYVNCEGRAQGFGPALPPPGEARPAWKVLRVLGNQLKVSGFDYVTAAAVRDEMALPAAGEVSGRSTGVPEPRQGRPEGVECIREVPLYRVDPVVRRAPSLQRTHDNPPPALRVAPGTAEGLGLSSGGRVRARADGVAVTLPLVVDPRVPEGCALIPGGWEETSPLGAARALELTADD